MTKYLFLFSLLAFSSCNQSTDVPQTEPTQTDEFVSKVSNYLAELSADEYFSLAIAISKDNEIIFEKAYGYANREHKVPNQIDTPFNIASIGKMFTAVAVLQLREAQKINLNETVGKYLPNFPNKAIRDSVTIHQLLTHTSGLPIFYSRDFFFAPKFDYLELKDFLPLYEDAKIDQKKVGSYSYSNVGYILLGFIIEKVSGESYKNYLNQKIFEPLKMDNTDIWKLTEIIPNAATGYNRPANKNDWWKNNAHLNLTGSPAGGAYASVLDLVTFLDALKEGKILSAASRDLMFSPQVERSDGHYGYGISLIEKNEKKVIGHEGSFFGSRGELYYWEDSGYTISILANSDQTDHIDVSYFIENLLTGTEKMQPSYQNTQALLRDKIQKEGNVTEDFSIENHTQPFDENLIQIKAYHFLNNQKYEQAELLFKLNSDLFPESESAKGDLEKVRHHNL